MNEGTGTMISQTTPILPDTVSLQRAQAGDREAFIVLAEQHLPALYRFVAREIRYHEALGNLEPDQVAVEDVVDEVFLTALRQLHRKPLRATFKGWLRHLALQTLRRVVRASREQRHYEQVRLEDPLPNERGVEVSYPLDPSVTWRDVIPAAMPSPEEAVVLKETQQTLEAALNQLSPEQREVFLLRAVEGLRDEEIAAMLGRPMQHVKSSYQAAREALRRWFFDGSGATASDTMAGQHHEGGGA
jgi:RNA polymerase sigma-70 factor, ECF subfamily